MKKIFNSQGEDNHHWCMYSYRLFLHAYEEAGHVFPCQWILKPQKFCIGYNVSHSKVIYLIRSFLLSLNIIWLLLPSFFYCGEIHFQKQYHWNEGNEYSQAFLKQFAKVGLNLCSYQHWIFFLVVESIGIICKYMDRCGRFVFYYFTITYLNANFVIE